MGQLIIKFRDNHPKKFEMEFKFSKELVKNLRLQEVIVNGVVYEEKNATNNSKSDENE